MQPNMPNRTASIETTGYATLALVEHGDPMNAAKAARWLVSQRNAYGGLGSTQDTVVGLQALTRYAANARSDVDMTVTINSMEKVTGEVEGGSKLATHAGHALDQIMQMAQQSAELIQGISQAAKQQAKASTGIVESMGQITTISQETAASSIQASQASSTMLTISQHLSKSVETFKLKED
jgi:hypothetical protein